MSFTHSIVYIEDNLADFILLKKSLDKSDIKDIQLQHIADGEEALTYFNNIEANDDQLVPDLIVLDVNLPRVDGFEILEKIKNSHKLKKIPTIMYSTSQYKEEINRAYALHANSYIVKSFDNEDCINSIKSLSSYWFRTVNLPKEK